MMKRRNFMSGAALAAVAPLPRLPAPPFPLPDAEASRIAFVIEGWSMPAEGNATDQVSIRINSGWRTAWR